VSSTHIWIDVGPLVRETDKAELRETDVGEVWIPKSAICATNLLCGRIEVKRWWAEQVGLADEKDGI